MTRLVPSAIAALIVVLALLSPAMASAEETVVGTWQGTLETQRGANEITLTFQAGDEGLEGTWTGPRGTSDLEDVNYADGSLTFVRNLELRGNSVKLDFTATVDGDSMQVTMKTPRGERQFTVTRVK